MRAKVGTATVAIERGDITDRDAEAIVNAANTTLAMGAGVAGAIKRKGGLIIEEEAMRQGPIEVGEAFAMLAEEAGRHFDPALVRLFLEARDEVLDIRERYADDVGNVSLQRRIDPLAVERPGQEARREADEPPSDDPDGDRAEDLQPERRQLRACGFPDALPVHEQPPSHDCRLAGCRRSFVVRRNDRDGLRPPWRP